MKTTNSTVIQVESVVVENKFIANVKKAIKRAFRPQWKKWKDSFDISRFVEAMWMQQVKKQELSPANYEQLCALEREIQVTKEVARYCFTKKVENVRTKQLCGYVLTEKEEAEACNYAVGNHFKFLSRGVAPTETDQSLSVIRDSAFAQVFKNTPIKTTNTEVREDFGVSVLNAIPSIVEALTVAIDAMQEAREVENIEVAAETLLTETVVDTTPSTDAEPSAIANKKTSINKLTIKELKSYAKRHKIYIPGKVTKVKQMKEIVIVAQNGSTKIRD
ncbi:MAG: hypothetical protein ABI417_09660 [Coleofasciculaceae cyanobacterium]